jgi:tetratricopeptide (TPR) repeat protein
MTNLLLLVIAFLFAGITAFADDYVQLRREGIAEYEKGQYTQAETLIRKSLDWAQGTKDDYVVALNYSTLGDIGQAQLRLPEAEQSYRKAMAVLSQTPEHDRARAILWRNLASTLMMQGRLEDASNALNEGRKLLGEHKIQDSQLTGELLNTLGVIQFYQGKLNKAESSLLQAATEISTAPATPQQADLGEVLNNLGYVYQAKGKLDKAEDAYKRSLQFRETRFGPTHLRLAATLTNLGALYSDTGHYTDAEQNFQRSLALLEREESPFNQAAVMHALYGLAKLYIRENDERRSGVLLARAAAIARKQQTPGELPAALEILETYSRVLAHLSNQQEAQQVQTEAKRLRATMAFTVSAPKEQ